MASKSKVKKSLIVQLRAKGADVDMMTDRIDAYMRLWDIEKQLADDINLRGVKYEETNVKGDIILKDNPSTKEIVAVSNQMLAILKALGISIDTIVKPQKDGTGGCDDL